MKQLIDDMLFLAKNDADRSPLVLSRIDLSDALWSSLLPFEALAFERGLSLESDIASNIFVSGDASSLKQLFLILLDNACKYSGSQGVITVKLQRSGSAAVLTVHNTGDPIPSQALPYIFDRFYRADASRARGKSPSGYGLGLSIAKSIADAHGASISACSNAEQGTTFTLTIPLAG